MPSKSKVYFFFEKKGVALANRTKLKAFIQAVLRKHRLRLGYLNYVFCSDKRILQVNKEFLNHDFYTDILTFDLSSGSELEAEIYISVDRVKDNSRKLGVPLREEIHRVIFHGLLHLTGIEDKSASGRKKMRLEEENLINQYFR
jgi:probable rRNA maturation factor